ncbi:MAG: DUF1835 domain-containing protein [Motiliproteus sp.]
MNGVTAAHRTLHITNGDSAGELLRQSTIDGDILVWRDLIFQGPRNPGWPSDATLDARAQFLNDFSGGGIGHDAIRQDLQQCYQRLSQADDYQQIVLWFDGCLHDQSVLVHVLSCLPESVIERTELLCIARFSRIEPFDGLGQLSPQQLASCYPQRQSISTAQREYGRQIDSAFADADSVRLQQLANNPQPPLPLLPAAIDRWQQEQPDPKTGFGKLHCLALEAIRQGADSPTKLFHAVASSDTHPQYWGDLTLWHKVNELAEQQPALIKISGPADRLPLTASPAELKSFQLTLA